jgi:hypothetical protein
LNHLVSGELLLALPMQDAMRLHAATPKLGKAPQHTGNVGRPCRAKALPVIDLLDTPMQLLKQVGYLRLTKGAIKRSIKRRHTKHSGSR